MWSYLDDSLRANLTGKAEIAETITPPLYHLRLATQADRVTIKALIRANRLNPLGLKWSQFILAETADNEIIGCGQVKPHQDGSYELASIAVIPSWRNQGIATDIIHCLLDLHAPPLWLTCAARLIPFYQKFGFVEIRDFAQMPPYFRRVAYLAHIILHLAPTNHYLAVMRYSGRSETKDEYPEKLSRKGKNQSKSTSSAFACVPFQQAHRHS